jgi:hypothetical protein
MEAPILGVGQVLSGAVPLAPIGELHLRVQGFGDNLLQYTGRQRTDRWQEIPIWRASARCLRYPWRHKACQWYSLPLPVVGPKLTLRSVIDRR